MDYTGLALVITAVGTLVVSVGSAAAALIAAYYSAKAHATAEGARQAAVIAGVAASKGAEDILRVEQATNGMKDELVRTTRLAGELHGREQQRDENDKAKDDARSS